MIKKRKSIQLITDPLLEPFFITKDEYSFAIKQKVKSDSTHFRSKGINKEYEKTICYHSTFAQTLTKIGKLKADLEDHTSLQSYVDAYALAESQIQDFLNKNMDNLKQITYYKQIKTETNEKTRSTI